LIKGTSLLIALRASSATDLLRSRRYDMMRHPRSEKMSIQKVKLDLRAIPPSIEERDGTYHITQSPITLAAVILRFKEGLSPETIRRDCFPALPLGKIYDVISFYLNQQEEVENYLAQLRQEEDELQQQLLASHPALIKTAETLRERVPVTPRT
jgi:uncharacterized protein (DUF433 family)